MFFFHFLGVTRFGLWSVLAFFTVIFLLVFCCLICGLEKKCSVGTIGSTVPTPCGKNGRRNRLKNRIVFILNHNIKKSQEKSK